MPSTPADDDAVDRDAARKPTALRRELRFAVFGVLFGIVALPFLIYAGGAASLGPYEGGLTGFLAKLYGDLAHGAPGAVALVLGPYVALQLLRLTSRPLRRRSD